MDRMELAQSETRFINRRRRTTNEIKEINIYRIDSARVLVLSFPLRNIARYLYCILRIFESKYFESKRVL